MFRPRALIALLAGCAGTATPTGDDATHSASATTTFTPAELVTAGAWLPLDPGATLEVPCTPLDWGAEPGGFEVRTDTCDGAVFEQPLLVDLAAGDTVEVGASHLDLWSPDGPAEAELVLTVGEAELWRAVIPIPLQADVLREAFASPLAAEAGAPVRYRVTNHGRNSYLLTYVTRLDHRTAP